MTQLKSLAHPAWPYAGTAHEWRGFVKDEKALKPEFIAKLKEPAKECEPRKSYLAMWYQKQNFGPELK